jgi:hypothetical protein
MSVSASHRVWPQQICATSKAQPELDELDEAVLVLVDVLVEVDVDVLVPVELAAVIVPPAPPAEDEEAVVPPAPPCALDEEDVVDDVDEDAIEAPPRPPELSPLGSPWRLNAQLANTSAAEPASVRRIAGRMI